MNGRTDGQVNIDVERRERLDGIKQGGFGVIRSIMHQRRAQDHPQCFGHSQMPAVAIGRPDPPEGRSMTRAHEWERGGEGSTQGYCARDGIAREGGQNEFGEKR